MPGEIEVETMDGGRLLVNAAYQRYLVANGIKSLVDLWSLDGESVKKKLAERGTERVSLCFDGAQVETYLKRYLPLPFKEYFKGITSFRPFFPSGALHEWESIIAFHAAGIPTMEPIAAGRFPDGRSVLLTLGVTNYKRASDLLPELNGDENRKRRSELISVIAELAGKMHSAQFAHQDFYLVHLFVKEGESSETSEERKSFQVLPIDLQRIIIGPRFSRRWRVKDLGQLLYSAFDCADAVDLRLFWRIYAKIAGEGIGRDKKLIKAVFRKADSIRKRSLRKKSRKS
ncbi:MAG: hypothetical protein GXP32_03815 [Kiritimatiellaeota bacterium]|nr:hypothetical protein [Kiritimatiellota bacterium]